MEGASATRAEGTTGRDADGGPELSVALITDGIELVHEVLGSLRAQTVSDRIELVMATPPGSVSPGAAENLGGFHSVRLVDADTRSSTAAARALAVRAASAPVIAFAETHCFPEPGWAEALMEAHRGPWTAVGPVIRNDNPRRAASWANLFIDYSPWLAPAASREVEDLPGHNSSYKRAALLGYGERLPELFESESILHWDMRARGQRLYVEAGAEVRHRNITRPRASLAEHFQNGRCFAALRCREWSRPHRALYALASPLIPAVRARRILRDARRSEGREMLWRALPALLCNLIAHGAGELWGYAAGPGGAVPGMTIYELDRDAYVEA